MIFRFLLGMMAGLLLGQLAQMDATPLVLVILAYVVGVLHINILKKLEVKNAKK